MQVTAIYPGTFDPITRGHVDLIERSLRLFDKVIVAIAQDTKKETIFSYKKRIELAGTVLQAYDRVEVCGFSGLLVKFAQSKGVKVMLRGLRAVSDFDYEFQLAGINRYLNSEIETLFLAPSDRYAYVSSSMIREAASLGGDISAFIHPEVADALRKYYTA